jgi:2-C-methyl-D-erythritol 4-phosphate cytidylyltransferase
MMLGAIIVAAGGSKRAGFDKLMVKIAGRSVIQHTLTAFEKTICVNDILVVSRDTITMRHLIVKTNLRKIRRVVRGGVLRQDSVRIGLEALEKEVEFVAVHDAARPLITSREIERVFAAARKHGAAALAAPITDALKLADVNHRVIGSIGRQNVFAMQTPQIFRRELLIQAYEQVRKDSLIVTDEVSTIEQIGGKVVVIVPAEDHNFKITFASDLPVAEFILKQRALASKL